jgi:GAF domain-containing protein
MKRNYSEAIREIQGIVQGEPNLIANLSNIAAILKSLRGYFWVGFYLVEGDQLVIGPFQGPPACTRIQRNKGVCGNAWERQESIVVEDVEKFPGHIACSALSKSEIVVPVFDKSGAVCMVLDVDSKELADFDEYDREGLERISAIITELV